MRSPIEEGENLFIMDFLLKIKTSGQNEAGALFTLLQSELSEALHFYWSTASAILENSGIRLFEPSADYFSLDRNFFSALFLYSYHRAEISPPRRVLYAAINQCLRGMVTGCDNLLDDEYKPTLRTDLPDSGTRFRSVLDIMVSDRVLFEILLRTFPKKEDHWSQILTASSATLRALTRSGAQEAGEEGGSSEILPPPQILSSVHHEKTGVLFQSHWAVPQLMEGEERDFSSLKEALCSIGMGCQIMDDMVDLATDIQHRHHNYIVSLIHHGTDRGEWQQLELAMKRIISANGERGLIMEFPQARRAASGLACQYLENGLGSLFAQDLQFLVLPVLERLAELIGADRYLINQGQPC